jgi:predicted nucleic acid-binding Zn ribbon protein
MPFRDHDREELDEAEFPDPDDEEDLDRLGACPHCGSAVFDDAERCPFCGRYLSREEAPARRSWAILLGVAACLAVVAMWIFRG